MCLLEIIEKKKLSLWWWNRVTNEEIQQFPLICHVRVMMLRIKVQNNKLWLSNKNKGFCSYSYKNLLLKITQKKSSLPELKAVYKPGFVKSWSLFITKWIEMGFSFRAPNYSPKVQPCWAMWRSQTWTCISSVCIYV